VARYLAVEWDPHEIRLLLASSSGGGRLKVHQAATAPMVRREAEGKPSVAELDESLRAAVAEHKVGRAVTLVAADRSLVEFLSFTVPPASEAELPELVFHQAMRESPTVAEDAALGFVALGDNPAEPRKVAAAAMSAEHLQMIQAACAGAGLKPRRLLLRSYALAAMLPRLVRAPEPVCMLVNRVAEEVDLVVLVDGKAEYLRTVRLPSGPDPEKANQRLIEEIRRTASVVFEEEAGGAVASIYLIGRPEESQESAARIGEELTLPVHVLDPFAMLGVPQASTPADCNRFAGLLAMILEEAAGSTPAVDFLHPRRAPQRSGRQRPLTFVAAGLLLFALVGGYYAWDTLAAVDAENQDLARQLKDLTGLMKRAGEHRKLASAVQDWEAGNVNWLDELRDLSIRFPSGRDMIVLRTSMTSDQRGGGGDIELQGVVREPSVVLHMEGNVRDKFHEVRSRRVQERLRDKSYAWHFETSMSVVKRDKSQYVSHLPEASPEGQTPAPASGKASTSSSEPSSPAIAKPRP
jgi:Tfp pilus assembly PilM family ATPase